MGKYFVIILILFFQLNSQAANDDLPRRPALGAALQPVDSTTRAETEISFDGGLQIVMIQPESTAETGGLAVGDILVSINGNLLYAVSDVSTNLKSIGGGKIASIEFIRDGKRILQNVKLKPVPLEVSDDYDINYDAITIDGYKRRIVVTKPHEKGKHPLFVILGSIGCYSLDPPTGMMKPYAEIVQSMTLAGFATLRIEKTGMGDSEDPPCMEQSFWDEVHGVIEVLKAVRNYKYIDSDKIVLFGVSTGSIVAPVVAAEIPVEGIIGYGTTAKDWTEYELGNLRRQRIMGGMEADSVDIVGKIKLEVMHRLVVEGQGADQIISDVPGSEVLLGYPVHTSYIRDLGRLNIAAYWKRYEGEALLIHGSSDFITEADDHRYICDIVNRYHPEHAQFAEIDDLDYFLIQTSDPQASFDNMVAGLPNLEFNTVLIDVIKTWCQGLVK